MNNYDYDNQPDPGDMVDQDGPWAAAGFLLGERDTADADELTEWEVENTDLTGDIPAIEGTHGVNDEADDWARKCAQREFNDYTRRMVEIRKALPPTPNSYASVAAWQRETARDDIANGFGE